MKMSFSQERAIIALNCTGTAFLQGDSAGGSKLIEQTLACYSKHFLDETQSNIRFVLSGQVMFGEIVPNIPKRSNQR